MTNKKFDSDWQAQLYGVAALGFEDASAAFTDADTYAVKGDLQGYGVSAQGNILTGKEVIERALAAFQAPPAKPGDDPVHPSTLVIVREDEGGANPVPCLAARLRSDSRSPHPCG